MRAVYRAIDSEGNEFSWTLNAYYFNGILYVNHGGNSPSFVATGIAAPDELIENSATQTPKGA